MKAKALTLFSLILLISFGTQAQKVQEKDILGTWKLVIEVEDELDEEAEEAETLLEEIIIKSVSGLVSGVLDNIDIYFEFKKNNDVYITVKAYGEVEEEKGKWYINRKGYLVIEDIDEDDDNDFHIDSDDEWKLIDGLLVSEEHEDDMNVYMTRVDD
ncbi:MAG: hypothetical protein RIM99_10505 [Cyclobacteriaceae bacterium]